MSSRLSTLVDFRGTGLCEIRTGRRWCAPNATPTAVGRAGFGPASKPLGAINSIDLQSRLHRPDMNLSTKCKRFPRGMRLGKISQGTEKSWEAQSVGSIWFSEKQPITPPWSATSSDTDIKRPNARVYGPFSAETSVIDPFAGGSITTPLAEADEPRTRSVA